MKAPTELERPGTVAPDWTTRPPPPSRDPERGSGATSPSGGSRGTPSRWGLPEGLYLRALRRWWWLPVVTAVVAAGTAGVLTSREVPRYLATATAIVAPTADIQDSSELLRSLDTLERRTVVATFARVASTRETRTATAQHLGLEAGEVSGHRITASVISSTNLIRIQAEGPDPEVAALLANAAVFVTEAQARRMYRIFTLETVESAAAPSRPVHPDPQRNLAVGVILGLFLGMLVAVAIEGVRGPAPAFRMASTSA